MELKYKKKSENEEDITMLVKAKIDSCSGPSGPQGDSMNLTSKGILVYLYDEKDKAIGFLSKKGFCPMYSTKEIYRVVSTECMTQDYGKRKIHTWFRVFRRKNTNE